MFKSYQLFTLVFGILFSITALAQTNVAVIDIEAAIARSNYAEEARKNLENSESFQKKRARYNELGKELKAMEKEGKTNGLTWSEEQKKNHRQSAKEKLTEINRIGKQLEGEIASINKKMAKELNPKIDEIVNAIIKEKKIDLLLNARAAHFASEGVDITKELLTRLNKAK